MNGLAKMTWNEIKLLWREPASIFFSLAFPTILVVILGSIPGFREPVDRIGGQRFIDLYVPIAITFASPPASPSALRRRARLCPCCPSSR